MNKKLLILAFVLLAGLTVSAQQIERVGRNVPGRGPGFQLPPLPEHVVLSLRDTSARTFEGRSSNNAPLFFIYPDAALDSVSAAALVSELGLPDIVRDFHASVYVINPSEGKYDDAADFGSCKRLLHRAACEQAGFFSGKHHQQSAYRDDAEPARLYQRENDDFAEQRPMEGGVVNDESRDANRRRGSEQRVDKRSPTAVRGRKGEAQKRRSQQNDAGKPQKYYLKRT